MPETDEEREARVLRELEGKNVAYYSTMLSAWIETKMERDKTLVTLSAAGIGLLVTILTALDVESKWMLLLFFISFIGFGFCIWMALQIYQLNSIRIENELNEQHADLKLKKYDKKTIWSFLLGVVAMCLIGLLSAYVKLEEKAMTEKNKTTSNTQTEKRSLDGISNLKPTRPKPQPTTQESGSGDKKKQ